MNQVQLQLRDDGSGLFEIEEKEERIAEMTFSIEGDKLTVFHTEVAPEDEGKGLAKTLLENMVQYARDNNLKVVPLCPYVAVQFKRHPQEYSDVWDNGKA